MCNSENFQCSTELCQAQYNRIFQRSLTLLASFEFRDIPLENQSSAHAQ